MMEEGTRVRLARNVERYPHFVAPAGAEGVITTISENLIAVRLDEDVEGADEWNNEVHWHDEMYSDEDYRDVFRADVEPLNATE